MDNDRIAVKINCLKMDPYEAMNLVAQWGIKGVHLTANVGPFVPDNIDAAGRRELLNYVRNLGLEITAVMGSATPAGGIDLCEAQRHQETIAWAKRLLELAADLECGIWGAHVGVMPWDTDDPRWDNIVMAMQEIAEYGEQVGARLAIETGPEPPRIVKRLIDAVGSEAIRVNYDPANLVIWPALLAKQTGEEYQQEQALSDFQPTEGAKVLGPYVVHTHAKDALVHEGGRYEEVPLGEGWVDWPRYIKYLEEVGYDGYFAIEREAGEDPVGDVRRAVDFLRSL